MSHKSIMLKEEEENLLKNIETSPELKKRYKRVLPFVLIVSVFFNILFTFRGLFNLIHEKHSTAQASYESGFASDLGPSRSEVELVVKSFSGGVELDSQGHFSTDQGGHEYVGPPTPAVDEAWETLLGGLNLDFDTSEVDLTGSTFQWPESGFSFSGLDVYHSLHCLNRLRQAMYPKYYTYVFDRPTDPSRPHHIDHCINHIRQALQCHADLTPMEWRLVGSRIILKTDTPHTCRNFDKIHAWATSKRTQFEKIQGFMNGSLVIVD